MTRPEPLCIWTILRHPTDYPRHVVVRMSWVDLGTVRVSPVACLCESLEEARAIIPPGLRRLSSDHPIRVETWIGLPTA